MTRIFKKPVKEKKTDSFSKELEELRARVKPETYLTELYNDISARIRELREIESSFSDRKEEEERILKVLQQQVQNMERELVVKREERARLEAPLIEREQKMENAFKRKESEFLQRVQLVNEQEQHIFERERECEMKLESVRDLADDLGETRVRLSLKEKTIEGRERLVNERENQYLLRVKSLEESANKIAATIQERENAITLKELNAQGKEENLAKREEQLIQDKLKVNSQRQALMAAQQHGNSLIAQGRQ